MEEQIKSFLKTFARYTPLLGRFIFTLFFLFALIFGIPSYTFAADQTTNSSNIFVSVLTVLENIFSHNALSPQKQAKLAEGVSIDASSLLDLQKRIGNLEVEFNSLSQNNPTTFVLNTAGGNLLKNSSFEVGGSGNFPSEWNVQLNSTPSNTYISAEGIHSGSYGLKFQGGGTGNFGISQPSTKTIPQRIYTLSAYMKYTNAPSATVRLGFWDEYTNTEGQFKDMSISGTKDWTRVYVTITTSGQITDSSNEFPMFEAEGLTSGNVYLDDVQLTEGSILTAYNSAQAQENNGLSLEDLGSGVLHSNGSGNVTSSAVNLSSDVTGTLGIGNGGTGQNTFTANGLVYVSSTSSALLSLASGTSGYVLESNGLSSAPSWVAASTVGSAFSSIGSGTNTTSAMVVGSGASLSFSGTGTINASLLNGATFASPGSIGSGTAGTGAFTTLSGTSVTGTTFNGLAITNNGSNTLTIASGKTLTANNSLTLAAGADNQTFTFPSSSGTVTVLGNTTTGNGSTLVLSTSPTLTTPNIGAATATTVNGLSLTSAPDGFTVAGGTTSRTLTVTGANITVGSTIQPTNAGAITLQSNGANGLTLDTGGVATVNIGNTNANAITIGNSGQNTTLTLNGSGLTTLGGSLAVNGGSITTTQTTGNILNTTATTINFGGAATSISLGASSGTTTINNNEQVTGNLYVKGGGPWYDVKAFGAKGDGSTDDTTAIQNAVNTEASTNGTVYFPPGTYKVTASISITNPVTIEGAGYGSYITGAINNPLILGSSTARIIVDNIRIGNTFTVDGSSLNYFTIELSSVTDSKVSDSFFTAGKGVYITSGSRIDVVNNFMSNLIDFGVDAGSSSSDLLISGNTIQNSSTSGLNGPPHDINLEDTDNSTIENNLISENGGFTESGSSPIQVYANHNANVSRNIIQGNVMRRSPVGTNVGIALGSAYNGLKIANNEIDGFLDGISYQVSTASLTGVDISGNLINNSQDYGIIFTSSASVSASLNINNNNIIGPGNVSGHYGIRISKINSASIQGNRVSKSPLSGIVALQSTYLTIQGNTSYDNNQTNGSSGDSAGIYVGGSSPYSDNNAIIGNTIYDDQATPTQKYGINIAAGNGNFVNNNTIQNNITSPILAATGTNLGNNDTFNSAAMSINTSGSLSLTAGGSNQNVTLTPSGTGYTILNGNVGIGVSSPVGLVQVSAATGNAAMFVSNTQGDIFTASAGATPKFVINKSGNVGIGNTNPTSQLVVGAGATGTIENGTGGTFTPQVVNSQTSGTSGLEAIVNDGTNNRRVGLFVDQTNGIIGISSNYSSGAVPFVYRDSTAERFRIDTNGNFGINTTSPLATFDVRGLNGTTPVATISGQTAKAALVVDNDGVGDLFTASSSGTTQFTIGTDGTTTIGPSLKTTSTTFNLVNSVPTTINFGGAATTLSIGASTGTTTINNNLVLNSSSATTTFGGIAYTWPTSGQSNGYVLSTNGSGTLSWVANGGGTNYWQRNLGTVAPVNITDDLLVGTTATGSASNSTGFQVFGSGANIATASTSGNLVFYGSAPAITTNRMIPLVIGDSKTGPIQLSPKGTTGLYVTGAGNVGVNITNPDTTFEVSGTGHFTGAISGNTYSNTSSGNNAQLQLNSTGATLLRNVGDTNPAFIIQQSNAGSTGDILDLKNNGSTALVVVTQAGNVGIGTTGPGYSLDVQSSVAASASAEVFNTNTGTNADGLVVKLGFTGNGTVPTGQQLGNSFIRFLNGNGIAQGSIDSNGNGGVTYQTGGVDFAEYFTKTVGQTFTVGNIVSLTGTTDDQVATLATTGYDPHLLGVVSEHPGFTGGIPGSDKVLVGLTGQIPIKVSTENGNIQPGDLLTSSATITGVAMKATQPGQIVAKALESYSGQGVGTIQAYVSVSYADPNGQLALVPQNQPISSQTILQPLTMTILNNLTTNGSLTVVGPAEFKANALFDTLAEFLDNVIFHGSVTFLSTPTFNQDTAGFAVIKQGGTSVDVKFQKQYEQTPLVNINPAVGQDNQATEAAAEQFIFSPNTKYIISNLSTNGFTIKLNQAAQADITFTWTALAVNNATTSTSAPVTPLVSPTVEASDTPTSSAIPTSTDTLTPTPSSTPSP